ncbi:flagellin N-terminal helical domain-containing protein [Tepidibacter mesophilus]|uniref:flagellin N-terminal helical domain-containing protein n=1 Tax=Tepidibacter mesophilus TaxID=655607 RepID=UPI00165142CB|nr:flagellin [Tepidibacter mesophilus]
MRINHNIPAMNAHRLLNVNNSFASKSLEKLSSGKRINRAGDDAAGMAIGEKMRAQINGLKMASRNSLDGVSLVQTAEGAMGEVHSMLQRMRELSVQAANGTMSESDRQAVQDEINQLTSEVNRIANGTEYNTRNILRGNEEPNSNTTVSSMSTGSPVILQGDYNIRTNMGTLDLTNTQLSIEVNGEETKVDIGGFDGSGTLSEDELITRINDALTDKGTASINSVGELEIRTNDIGGNTSVKLKGSAVEKLVGNNIYVITPPAYDPASPYENSALLNMNESTITVDSSGMTNEAMGTAENAGKYSYGYIRFDSIPENESYIKIGDSKIDFYDSSVAPYLGANLCIDINGKSTTDIANEVANMYDTISDIDMAIDEDDTSRLVIVSEKVGFEGNLIELEGTLEDFNTNLQVGANTGQSFRLEIGDIRARALRISSDRPTGNPGVEDASYVEVKNVTDGISSSESEYAIDVSDERKASAAIKVFDNAIVQIASERSKLGATQNRLEHTIANLDNTAENLTAAMSRIEDTDMALEMANYQKLNVLQQAGVSMLAQANQQPQSILKLLG